jgi:hypothetical protein
MKQRGSDRIGIKSRVGGKEMISLFRIAVSSGHSVDGP